MKRWPLLRPELPVGNDSAIGVYVLKKSGAVKKTATVEVRTAYSEAAIQKPKEMHVRYRGSDIRTLGKVGHPLKASSRAVPGLAPGGLRALFEKADNAGNGGTLE